MSSAKLIDGKAQAENLRQEMSEQIRELVSEKGRRPALAVVLVGQDPASAVYVRNKHKMAEAVGMESLVIERAA